MKSEQSNLIKCPSCESDGCQLIHWPRLVKMFTSRKRFVCLACGKLFHVERAKARIDLSLIR